MRDFRDAKAMAQTLRAALSAKAVAFTHSESQELIAQILGFRDWNVLAARIQASPPTTAGFQASVRAAGLPSISPEAGVPVITMRDLVLFPQMTLSIFVGRDDTRRGVAFAMAGDRSVLVVAQRRDIDNDPNSLETLHPVGVTASVINCQTQPDGVLKVSLSGLQR